MNACCPPLFATAVTLAALLCTTASPPARADGFSRPHSLQMRLAAPGMNVTRESMRGSLNREAQAVGGASAAQGDVKAQSQSSMANVIQLTENYEIVLNGDGNTVSTTTGGVAGTQDGTGLTQRADNQIQLNNGGQTYANAPGGTAQAGTITNPTRP